MQPSRRVPVKFSVAAVISKRGRVLLQQRSQQGLLAGMWEFPNFETKSSRTAKTTFSQAISKQFSIRRSQPRALGAFTQTYSHFISRRQVFSIELNGSVPKIAKGKPTRWLPIYRLDKLPMGKLDRLIAFSLRDNVRGR
jgi:A/G-specific adenine glycosylase